MELEAETTATITPLEPSIILGFDTKLGLRSCHITKRPWGLFVELFVPGSTTPFRVHAFNQLYDVYICLVQDWEASCVHVIEPEIEPIAIPIHDWLRTNEARRLVDQPDITIVDASVDIEETVTPTDPPYISASLRDFVLTALVVFLGGALAGVASVWFRMLSN